MNDTTGPEGPTADDVTAATGGSATADVAGGAIPPTGGDESPAPPLVFDATMDLSAVYDAVVPDLPADARAGFDRMWKAILPIGRHDTGWRRYAWTDEDAQLRAWFVEQCESRGLDVSTDVAGNTWAWWDPAGVGGPGLVFGSHLDSVPDGGAYDGPLGLVSALAALDVLRASDFRPARPIGLVDFVDEEGARFGVACMGSRIITGVVTAERVASLADADGVTWPDAMRAAGLDPSRIGPAPDICARIGTYVELHVEQGRALVDLRRPLAVGTGILPHGRWRLDIAGRADHAGTTLLVDRDDAMLPLARAVLTARESAERHGCVATIGKVRVLPGGVNAIPSHATGWLDVRGADEAAVRTVVAEVGDATGVTPVEESWTPATLFDGELAEQLAAILGGAPLLDTGAGHDAGILAGAGITSGMIYVRNPTGASHTPEEYSDPADCHAGVAALVEVARHLAS